MDIKVSELKQRLNKGENLNFFDVREPWEYSELNIGAQLMPLASIPDQLNELNSMKDQEIIVHEAPKGSTNRRKADISKIQSMIDWTPTTTLKEGLTKTLETL